MPEQTTIKKTVEELIDSKGYCPLPLDVIPNNMGINLCSVDSIEWTKQADGQLLNLKINFLPSQYPSNFIELVYAKGYKMRNGKIINADLVDLTDEEIDILIQTINAELGNENIRH